METDFSCFMDTVYTYIVSMSNSIPHPITPRKERAFYPHG